MQTPKIINAFFCFLFLGAFLISCESTIVETSYIPETQGINASVELIRFEQAFFNLDTANIGPELKELENKYPKFTGGYLSSVLGVRDSISGRKQILGYLNYADARYTYDTVQQVFGTMPLIQTQLNQLATYYQYYFPKNPAFNKAFTYLSEYHGDRLAVIDEGFIGLPLDMALGQGYPPYTFLKIPVYDQRTCTKEHLVPKAADAIAQNLVAAVTKPKGNHLIDLMLYNGKIMYLTDVLLPTVEDSLLFGFSSLQMQYCKAGEYKLYEHIVGEELMYSSETKKINKYISKGPFKPQFDLPGNSGSWLGYRMICSYERQLRSKLKRAKPNLSTRELDQEILQTILKETEPQKFLTNYKPPKG
ncbi:MAG: Unknown protein [uncultured Aureispira sp.]|uniref:Gliding motility protein GldB n=1 Tax=uncultured Aureispira sp. TaxID=1331704 RepID=A0A6S6S124_9BACT|nr:MAG: Unknown protein [uncultured Aureispira sp.]